MKSICIVCLVIFYFSSCKNPVDNKTGTEENLIQNSSFELNGNPTREGWTYYSNFPTDTSDGIFSNDVPPGGGNWSLVVGVGDRVVKYLETKVAAPTGEHYYRLSAWAKTYSSDPGSGSSFISLALNDSIRKLFGPQDTTWRYYESIDTILTRPGDTLDVRLFGGAPMRFRITYFDLCRLELLK